MGYELRYLPFAILAQKCPIQVRMIKILIVHFQPERIRLV
jgi:hypothetical protein